MAVLQGMQHFSSATRDQIHISRIGRQSLNYWTSGKVLPESFLTPCILVLLRLFSSSETTYDICGMSVKDLCVRQSSRLFPGDVV